MSKFVNILNDMKIKLLNFHSLKNFPKLLVFSLKSIYTLKFCENKFITYKANFFARKIDWFKQ